MAFTGKAKEAEKRVVLEVVIPNEEGQAKYRYLIPRLRKAEIIRAQRLRGGRSSASDQDGAVGSFVIAGLYERIEAIDGSIEIDKLIDEVLDDDSGDQLIEEVARLATTSINKLINEGVEVR